MSRLAILQGNVVKNIILGELANWPGAILVDSIPCCIGWTYDDQTQEFTESAPQPPSEVLSLPVGEFLSRLTDDELGGIRNLAETNQTAAGWVDWLRSQPTINKNNSRLVAGLDRLVTAGKLTSQRRDEILDF